jgi:hypothetical protein
MDAKGKLNTSMTTMFNSLCLVDVHLHFQIKIMFTALPCLVKTHTQNLVLNKIKQHCNTIYQLMVNQKQISTCHFEVLSAHAIVEFKIDPNKRKELNTMLLTS